MKTSFVRRKSVKSLFAWLLVLVMVLGNGSILNLVPVKAAGEPQLKNVVIAEIGKLNPEFASATTSYTATTYMSVNTLTIFPFKQETADTVTIGKGGETPTTVTGNNVKVPIVVGENVIEVKVSNGSGTTTYTFTITKKNTDYRGRTIIPNSEIKGETTFGGDVALMLDGNVTTGWEPTTVPTNESETNPATSFILDIGKTRWVSRIQADMDGNGYAVLRNIRISVSTDKTNWTTVVDKGNMREDQKTVRYEFGKSFSARYIKYEIFKFTGTSCKILELTVFEDSNGEFPTYAPPADGATQFVPSNPNLARGQEIVIEKGFPIAGWMPSGGYGRGTMTKEESEMFGWDGPLFYDPALTNVIFMQNNPDALWGLAKAPFGDNGMGNAGTPRKFVDESLLPYIKNAVSFCYGDEGGYGTQENARFKEWFDFSKETYPGTIVHSNQAGGRGWEGKFPEYVKATEPDMLSFDDYYWHLNSNQWNGVYGCLNTNLWKQQREAALKGVDGTGNKPILFGQYLDVYQRDQPISQKNLVVNLSMLTGMKWLNHFRVEYQFDGCYLFDVDGTPTRGFYEWGEVNRYLKTIDDYILRLNNDYVVTLPGKHLANGVETNNNVATGWNMASFADSTTKNEEFGITGLIVNNIASANNKLPGDVVLGYFNALPGLTSADIQSVFGASKPKAFMVLNGLIDGTYASWNNPNVINKELGSEENTTQEITISVDPARANGTLIKVNRDTGVAEPVTITNNTVKVTLGGGEAELFYWAESVSSQSSEAEVNREAKFAFDGDYSSYWQSKTATGTLELSNTFASKEVKKIIINERGTGITNYKLQYQNGTNWVDLPGATGTTIGASKVITLSNAVTTTGIKLLITGASQAPAIKEFHLLSNAEIATTPRTVTVTAGTNGSVANATLTVNDKEDAVIVATPANGYSVEKAMVNNIIYYPEGNTVVIPNVTENISVNVSFTQEIPEVVNAEILTQLLQTTTTQNKLTYKGSSWSIFEAQINKAKEVLANKDATATALKTAYRNVSTAYNQLTLAADTTPKTGITGVTTFIDNTDQGITYNGSWTNGEGAWTVNKHMNSQQVLDDASAGSIRYDFMGSGIDVYMEARSNSANMDVQILNKDGQVEFEQKDIVVAQDASASNSQSLTVKPFSKSGLALGKHTIVMSFKVNAAGQKRAAFDGFFITKAGEVSAETYTSAYAEGEDANVVKTGAFTTASGTDSQGHGGKHISSNVEGASVSYTFTGNGISVYTKSGAGAGIANIYLDGVLVAQDDQYEATASFNRLAYQELFTTTGTHTIKVVRSGQKNTASTGTALNFDCFKVYTSKEQPQEPVLVDSVTITPNISSIKKGESKQLTAQVASENATNSSVTWSSSDSTIASVSNTGLVQGLTKGTVMITATAGGKNAVLNVEVTEETTPGGETEPETPDKAQLLVAINQAKGYKQADYTEASFTALTEKLTAAQVVFENAVASEKEIDEAKKDLETAITNLEKVVPQTKKNGWFVEDNRNRYYVEDVPKANSWIDESLGKKRTDADGFELKGWASIGATRFFLDLETGLMKTGWIQYDNFWYFLQTTGEMKTGWLKDKGTWYFLENTGKMKTGWLKDKGACYFLQAGSGKMKTGWLKDKGAWYFLEGSGKMKTGWLKDGGAWYFLEGSGKMKTGWLKDGGAWYFLQGSGKMKTGWLKDGGAWYFLQGSGKMKTGWLKDGGVWYYLQGSGKMKTGWLKEGTIWYYLQSSGVMKTGWLKYNNQWYYLKTNGAMAIGWEQVGLKRYYLTPGTGIWNGQVQ